MSRKSWDEYFMNIAVQVATRATCDRKHVGAVLVKDKFIVATGYNGSIGGLAHCDEVGHMMINGHCERTTHAEANAVVQAAKRGACTDGTTAYVTASPCWHCFKILAGSGVKRIVFLEFYRDERIFEAAELLNIQISGIEDPPEKPAGS